MPWRKEHAYYPSARPSGVRRCTDKEALSPSMPSAGSPSSSTRARSKTLSWSTPNIERQHEQLAVPNRIVLLRSRDAPQHGGLQPRRPEGRANDPRARDISERINAHIDAALFRARDEVWTHFDPLLDKQIVNERYRFANTGNNAMRIVGAWSSGCLAPSSSGSEVTSTTGKALFRLRFRKLPMAPGMRCRTGFPTLQYFQQRDK
jgi:hypothetical protein